MSQVSEPLEIRAPKGARMMEIDWEDGHHSLYPHHILRGFCPCAHCQGHEGPIRYVEGGNLELESLDTVGNYAIRLTWADQHSTGIYSFAFLRKLCMCGECMPEAALSQEFDR